MPPTAYLNFVKENYSKHPIGPLLLAIQIYQDLRESSDTFLWHYMEKVCGPRDWDSDKFLHAAKSIITLSTGF